MIQEAPLSRRQAPFSALRWRMRRGFLNVKRLDYEASVLASVHGAVRLGPDLQLAGLLRGVGLGDDAISILRFRQSGCEFSLVLPTERTWRNTRAKGRAYAVCIHESAAGRLILIVPPAELKLRPRLNNAKRIFHTKMVPACGDLETLTACINDRGGEATLIDCEAVLAGLHPRNRVFGLVYGGHLAMNLNVAITDLSTVRLQQSNPKWSWEVLGWRPIHTA
jgi:hypothetical protein